MSGKADIQVSIGGDSKPLQREVATARQSVHGFAKEVERGGQKLRLLRMPEGLNLLKVPEGLLTLFSVGGVARIAIGLSEAAAKTRDLAGAAKLPVEEYLRLQEAAKVAGVPVEELNKLINDYASGRKTLEEVGNAVGLIGMKAGGASGQIKDMAERIRDLAEYNDRLKEVKEGAEEIGGKSMIGLSNFFQRVGRMAVETTAQGRPVGWFEAGDMMQQERERDRKVRDRNAERAIRDHDTTIGVQRDLAAFFGDIEKQGEKVAQIRERSAERIEKITVQAPKAGDTLASVAGYMGGKADNSQRMLMERQIKIAEEQAATEKEIAKVLKGD